jgi:uncharacterized protein YraI
MNRFWINFINAVLVGFVVSVMLLVVPGQARASQESQAQSGVIATVTYSESINVRGGPNTAFYPIVGRANPGDIFPALGVSPGREWVEIAYPDAPGGVGWVYAVYVSISGGELQVAEPPPTPTPIATATINPTFAAAFVFQATPTRMPTFTPPPPLQIPDFGDDTSHRPSGVASGFVAISLMLIAVSLYLVSLIIGKK